MNRFARPVGIVAIALGVIGVVASPSPPAPPPVPFFAAPADGYAAYDAQAVCDPVEKPGVQDFRDLVLAAYPATDTAGVTRLCEVGPLSEHKEGRAWDWRVSAATQGRYAADLLHWLLATRDGQPHALLRRFGIMYVIWNRKMFRAYSPELGWQPYHGANPHTDHVHFSFGWAGALGHTSWWTGRATPHTSYRVLGG